MAWGKEWKTQPVWPEIKPEEIGKQIKIILPKDFKIRDNKIPTHDPYTNPGAFLYYQCDCGEVLDPKTKRFAELNNYAMNGDWKIRWGANGYVPYCPKCVVEKEIE